MNRCFYAVAGFDNPDEVVQQMREIEAGRLPGARGMAVCVNSLFDPSYAPPGKHSMLTALFFPPASSLTREQWQEVKLTYTDLVLDRLRRWAPNMTRANVIADKFITPLDFQDECRLVEGDFCNGSIRPDQLAHNRPFPEAAQYRTEVKNLYVCGASTFPGGMVIFGAGYNAANAIAADRGIEVAGRDRVRGGITDGRVRTARREQGQGAVADHVGEHDGGKLRHGPVRCPCTCRTRRASAR